MLMSSPPPVTYRQIIAIALPVIAANILLPLQGLVDTAVMGHFPDPAYLSALGLSASTFALLYTSLNFLQYATSGLSARALGQRDYDRLRRILWRALLIAAVMASLIIIGQSPIIRLAVRYFHADSHTAVLMEKYIHTRIWGAPFELGIYCTVGWFAGQSQTLSLLYQQGALTLSNIIISLLLVYGFDLGVSGVALGTVCANILALVVGILLVQRRQQQFRRQFFRPDWARIFRLTEIFALFRLNRDLFIRTAMLVLCTGWFQRMGSQLGETTLAANIILLWLLSVASYALDGVAVAAEGLTGQTIGQNNLSQLRTVIRRCSTAGLIAAALLSCIYALGFPYYLRAMTNLSQVAALAQDYHLWAVMLPLAGVGGYLLDGFYFGATAAAPLRNTMLIIAAIVLPLSQWLTGWLGNTGLWLSVYAFLLLRPLLLAPQLMQTLKRPPSVRFS